MLAEVQNILNNLSEADDTFKANLHSFSVHSPYEIQPEAHIEKAIQATIMQVFGEHALTAGIPFWVDAVLLGAVGV